MEIKNLWDKVDSKKKTLLSKIVEENLIINNDYFWTIPLNALYNDYNHLFQKNKTDITNLIWLKNTEFLKLKQIKSDKINMFLDFEYNEINPKPELIEKTLSYFISSILLWYNYNSINNYKIVNISLYQENNSDFQIYNFKSILNNIREYIIILNFILWWIKFNTDILKKFLLKSNNKKQNLVINELIKKKTITFDQLIDIIWINRELILSQELWTLIYNIDLTNNNFENKKEKIIKDLGIETNEDLFRLLFTFLYFNFK